MAHSYTNLLYHIVYATKERRPLIDVNSNQIVRLHWWHHSRVKSTSLEIGGVEDHVHILAKLPPTIAVAGLLEKLKANTTKMGEICTTRIRLAGRLFGIHGERIPGGPRQSLYPESA